MLPSNRPSAAVQPSQGFAHPRVDTSDPEAFYKRLKSFNDQYLDQEPALKLPNEYANNSEYIPIHVIESSLVEVFGGYFTKNFNYSVIMNEICCSIEVWVWHPVFQTWVCETGVAAQQIRTRSKKWVDVLDENGKQVMKNGKPLRKAVELDKYDPKNKIINALQMDLPHARSSAIKNAAKSLGRRFGRELNRDEEFEYLKSMSSDFVSEEYYNAIQEQIESETSLEKLKEIHSAIVEEGFMTQYIQNMFTYRKQYLLASKRREQMKKRGGKK